MRVLSTPFSVNASQTRSRILQMLQSPLDPDSLATLKYIITHVFCPIQLPTGDDHSIQNDHSLAEAVVSAAQLYCDRVSQANLSEWDKLVCMLDNMCAMVQFESLDQSQTIFQLMSMNTGDVLTFLIRAQNAAIVARRQKDVTIIESFEASPMARNVMAAQGKLICCYPGPAIEVPNHVFNDKNFLAELANFLVCMNKDVLDATPTSRKAQSTIIETRDTTHPRYITELLTGILRSFGRPANITRIHKRIGDDVVWNNSKLPWRRSSLWLVIRVALQTSLNQSPLGNDTYKEFMLFFMCYLAKEKISKDLPNDLLQFMSAKISRRLGKLGSSTPNWLIHTVSETCSSLRSILEKRWKQVRVAQCLSPVWIPSQLHLSRDIQLSLQGSGDYIRNSLANHSTSPTDAPFNPNHHLRGTLEDFLSLDGTFFKEVYHREPHVTLYDFERGVEKGIDGWVERVTDNDAACEKLELLAKEYSSSALKTYRHNPELLSVMLLTVMELWVALDKIAIRAIPMLADYSPEIPTSLLEDLLLSKRTSLHRLRLIHEYLSNRHCQSQWSAFPQTITSDSFAVRFYRGSSRLQSLKAQIDRTAQEEVHEKLAELERKNVHYADLQRQAANSEHQFATHRHGYQYHAHYCTKCSLEKQCRQMEITVHEWPLPDDQLWAEAVVFELDCPVSFNMWRTATFYFLVDLCSLSVERRDPYILLAKFTGLQDYLVQHPRSRITLASDTKPFVVTHYSRLSLPATQEQVCVKNGLKFYGFDSGACIPFSQSLNSASIQRYCTYTLSSSSHPGAYDNLQKYINTTCQSSNEVVANQADCHRDLSIHEYMAFGHLRSGGFLQWLNILRELRGRSLTFRRPEVHLLFAQAVSQVGPLSNSEWTWHQDLRQPSFCHALLRELERLVLDVEANWLEVVTMDTVSFLLRRFLASDPDPATSLQALELLRAVRGKVFSWVEELSDKLTKTPGDEELHVFLRDAAAVCRGTFDVDPITTPKLLYSAADVNILVRCAVFIHDYTPSMVSSLSAYSQLLLDRDRRLSLTLEDILRGVIQADPNDDGVDLALGSLWPAYRPGSKWTPLQNPQSRWIMCSTAPTATECSQVVHFNLLDGSLLVDGKPVARLPSDILEHPVYNLIFGEQVLDIIPSDLPGMDYTTKGEIAGHQVYFSLRNKDLIIRAKREDSKGSETMELIPQERLQGDLPVILIEGHVHWLNLSTSIMEIRRLDSLWENSPASWKMDCSSGHYRMQRGNEFLVDIRSQSWKMVSALLHPFDIPSNLIVSAESSLSSALLGSSSLQLSVMLSRYGLSFYVNGDGDLQSRNIRGMVYDKNQSIGTMFGLVNRLVLRPKARNMGAVDLISRCVLIPEGRVSFHKDGDHVCVKVHTQDPSLQRVKYQTYRIDTDLGCMTGNVSLANKLYCAYLHALTSGCGPDPLTGRSGTEEALSLLRSAGCWSIHKLVPRDEELLSLIASICPSRTWYPSHLHCMQKVEWNDLPTTSQHHDFYVIAKAIMEHNEKVQSFNENRTESLFGPEFPSHNDHLLERSARRTAYLFPFESSSRQPTGSSVDVCYPSRDVVALNSGEQRAHIAAITVYNRTAGATTIMNILSVAESWPGDISGDASLSLRYDKSWLNPNLPLIWIKAYKLLRMGDERKWFQLLFSMSAMAYAKPELSNLVPVFMAFASDQQFCFEDPPSYGAYTLSDDYSPSRATLRGYVSDCAYSLDGSPEGSEPARHGESEYQWSQRQRKRYNSRVGSDAENTANRLLQGWPCEIIPRCSLDSDLYDVAEFTTNAQSHFSTCFRNLKLKEHLRRVQSILDDVQRSQEVPSPDPEYSFHPSPSAVPSSVTWIHTLEQLFSRTAPLLRAHDKLPRYATDIENASQPGLAPLHQLVATAEANAMDPFQHQYVSALRDSAKFLGSDPTSVIHTETKLPSSEELKKHYAQCKDRYIEAFNVLSEHLGPRNLNEEALKQSGQWPRITPYTLFQSLASSSPIALSDNWRHCLVTFTLIALELQRARRLLHLHLDNLTEEIRKELQNEGCDGWEVEMYPDWLLIQLQSNFLVRRVQAEVAHEMISPCSGNNTAMQLNMGEGKSSVIVPIVVSVLSDGHQLVRVIVPKALTVQMFHTLVDRLGGLVNRRLYFLPFSRSIQLNDKKVAALRELLSECMEKRGILVVQPEHVLSLKLLSVEKQLLGAKEALQLLQLQKWLYSRSRDILDESDEILHVRYQLVYTIGNQKHMEGHPERWTTTEQILGLVSKRASSLWQLFPQGVEYQSGPSGSFPHFRILHAEAGQTLITWIAQDVMDGLLPNFNFGQLRSGIRNAIQTFISCKDVPPDKIQSVKDYAQQTSLWSGILHLRGLLACGVLLFAFKERRWRVDYGLALQRTMLAVPYRAKDVPAQRAEFGHPDIAIIHTCLSYYYGGLSEEQLRLSFEILLKQDDPSLDYAIWVKDCCTVPASLKTFSGINIKSSEQWEDQLYPLFRRNRATVDFYLSSVVFPKEAKEFPSKLSCSGWDLAENKEHLLTGFSGTNDGRYLLPLDITQRDPDHQRGTNAKVISYLLQLENRHYMCTSHDNGERRTTREFLEILVAQEPPIRVLLDVGAQMLDLQNYLLAQTWLEMNPDASAAIYFNEDDELMVRTRDGSTQLFLSSPFAQQLDQCVIYLDDAHTRGTDIKFPSGFRAAVTLGPKVTKDRLAQGCMRMRKLGHGHSIMFFAPLEVDRRIRFASKKASDDSLDTVDILHWTIRETCDDIQQRAPHWAQQGIDHTARYAAWMSFCANDLTAAELSDKWLQPEAKKLEDLYGPHTNSNLTLSAVPAIHKRCAELGILSLRDVSMDEEQEREVIHEAERERQVERPPRVTPANHFIHKDLVNFIKTGVIPVNSNAFRPAFESLDATSAVTDEAYIWSHDVLTTMDFASTVHSSGQMDEYLRPVQWVVSAKRAHKEALVILSPHEVNCLVPYIRSSTKVHLHLYTPRVTKTMKPCDDLRLYSVPQPPTRWTPLPTLMDQLNVFAGQLYLKDYETYIRLCRFLCVYAKDLKDEESIEVCCDGFIPPNHRPSHLRSVYTFQESPLGSLKNLTSIRRKGMRFAPTHMGHILNGQLLSERDFDDSDNLATDDH